MSNDFDKIQFYMAANMEEYNKALAWVRNKKFGETIKEVGEMDSTDWDGKPIKAYVFLFTAPNGTMQKLSKFMSVPFKMI